MCICFIFHLPVLVLVLLVLTTRLILRQRQGTKTEKVTRKQRQSYRHADPRRQRPQIEQHRNTQYQLWSLANVRRDGFRNPVTLTFDPLTSGSMHAERLLCSIRVPSSVLIAQSVFLLERGHTVKQTDKQTDKQTNAIPTPVAMPA